MRSGIKMEIKIPVKYILSKDVHRISFAIYLHLLTSKQYEATFEFSVERSALKNMLSIRDNNTLKKMFKNMYDVGMLKKEITELSRKGELVLTLEEEELDENEYLIIDRNVGLKYVSLEPKYNKLICYYELYTTKLIHENSRKLTYREMTKVVGVNKNDLTNAVEYLNERGIMSIFNDRIKDYDQTSLFINNTSFPEKKLIKEVKESKSKLTEADLERLVCLKLNLVEEGMELIKSQLKVKEGIIDILAKDKTGQLCIIELKVVPDDVKLVFQCVYYPTQILGNPRVVTIAPDYEYRIKTSLEQLSNVTMMTYKYDKGKLLIDKF